MAKAKKLPSGNWRVRVFDYTDSNGKDHVKSFTAPTKKEAEYLATQYKLTKRKITQSITVYELINNYISIKSNSLSPTSLSGYRCDLRNHFDLIKDIYTDKLTSDKLQMWIDGLALRLSPKTVSNSWGLLMAALDHYHQKQRYDVKLPQRHQKQLYTPTDEEVLSVISYFKEKGDTDMVIAIYLGAYGSLRRSEICGLTTKDVKGNTIIVNKALVELPDGSTVLKTTKTTSSTRTIQLPKFVVETFPSKGNIVNLSPNVISKRFIDAIKKLDVNHFRFHDLRAYSVSIMHMKNIPDVILQQRGGWASDRVLKQIYRRSISDFAQKYTDEINGYFEQINEKT
jgi:integrase